MADLSDEEKELLKSKDHFYRIRFKNIGGLVMPIILNVTFEDGSTKEYRYPAEIWRMNSEECSARIVTSQPIRQIELDPLREIADVDRNNNYYPPKIEPTRFKVFKARRDMGGIIRCSEPKRPKKKRRS